MEVSEVLLAVGVGHFEEVNTGAVERRLWVHCKGYIQDCEGYGEMKKMRAWENVGRQIR